MFLLILVNFSSDDGHPLPDCRGYDEEDDKMDTSDAELSDVADSQFHVSYSCYIWLYIWTI